MLTTEFLSSIEWNQAIGRIIRAEGSQKAGVLLDEFQNLLNSDELMLIQYRKSAGPKILLHSSSGAVTPEQMQEYKKRFYLADPFFLAIERVVQQQSMAMKEVVDLEDFETSEFYLRHYGFTNLSDELCYCVPDDQGGYVLVSFARSNKIGRYTDDELELAKRIAPIINAGLAATWASGSTALELSTPTPEEVKQHQDLRTARDNFGRSVLTEREFQVVQMMLRGYPIDLISSRLQMAEGTTKVHRRNIYRKLDIGSKAELFSLFLDVVGEIKIHDGNDPLIKYEQVQMGVRSDNAD